MAYLTSRQLASLLVTVEHAPVYTIIEGGNGWMLQVESTAPELPVNRWMAASERHPGAPRIFREPVAAVNWLRRSSELAGVTVTRVGLLLDDPELAALKTRGIASC